MPSSGPEVVIRLGSHAEKEYVRKLAKFLGGLIVGANLFEVTPGATASLLLAVSKEGTRLYVDPMTYAYGEYTDPRTGVLRTDLDWIKSEQTCKDEKGRKATIRDFKRSYRRLAAALGTPLSDAVQTGTAVTPQQISDGHTRTLFCESVADYQLRRIARVFDDDEELRDLAGVVPEPSVAFAPYFYVEPTHTAEWLEANLKLMKTTAELGLDVPVHGILCADKSHLADADLRDQLLDALPETGVAGVWLWFSGFLEDQAETRFLSEYRDLVIGLAERRLEVRAMHGGFFSLALNRFGMRGISHGVGYGEQKDVVPVIGQSMPTVRYYLPPLARRLGVPDIERAFDALHIKTPSDFHEKVCKCAVCAEVVSDSLDEFSAFGDMRFSRPTSKRQAQTPAAAKRCRFHFLLNRIRERREFSAMSIGEVTKRLDDAASSWGAQRSLADKSNHLRRWSQVLRDEVQRAE